MKAAKGRERGEWSRSFSFVLDVGKRYVYVEKLNCVLSLVETRKIKLRPVRSGDAFKTASA